MRRGRLVGLATQANVNPLGRHAANPKQALRALDDFPDEPHEFVAMSGLRDQANFAESIR